MGADWVRMSPSSKVARGLLEELIERQAAEFLATVSVRDDEFEHLNPPVTAVVPDSGSLARNVGVGEGPASVRRVSFVTRCQVLPAEWRCAAFRSYLPDQLASALRIWGTHLDQVRAGAHRDYLYAWYRYSTEREFAVRWQVLRELALAARHRGNNWARRPALVDIRERILTAPRLPASPPPYWRQDCVVPGDDGSYDALAALVREWNRMVPQNQKVSARRRPDFAEFMASELDSSWLREGFAWLRSSVEDRHGLLLDW